MDPEAFVGWALDKSRTLEERYTTELLVERGVSFWNGRRQIYKRESLEETMERQRQRSLNPAYEPQYTEESLRKGFEGLRESKQFDSGGHSNNRPVRNIAALRFLPFLETLRLASCEVEDISPLSVLTNLQTLHFGSFECADFRPLAHCRALVELQLSLVKPWPEVDGLSDLACLNALSLKGNLLVFEGATFPHVISASIECEPLPARSVRDLPQVPRCKFLMLGGMESLEGVEAFREVRNLSLKTPFKSFEPLVQLPELTCLTVHAEEPLDLSPLARVPRLQYLALDTRFQARIRPKRPRDVAPLIESPTLRELEVLGCPVIDTEVAAIRAGLPSWNDLLMRAEPRPIPPLKLRAIPFKLLPREKRASLAPHSPDIIDAGLRDRELRWVSRQCSRAITHRLGTGDWGEVNSNLGHSTCGHFNIIGPIHRTLNVEFHSYGLLDKYPLFIEAIRDCLAWLGPEYRVEVSNFLKAPRPEATPEQVRLEEQFREEQDQAEFEQRQRDREAFLERLHRYEILKQDGAKVNPAEFAPQPRAPLPLPPWEREEEGEDVDAGDVMIKQKPEPPPSWLDDEHPLAKSYWLTGSLTLESFSVDLRARGTAEYLLQRACDEVIEEPKPEGS